MSSDKSAKKTLRRATSDQFGRRLSARILLYHQAVADKLGINATDLKCIDLARNETNLTAGRIAEVTGLTTAAVTSVLDRLESRGMVRRVRDQQDRRKVFVQPVPEKLSQVAKLFEPLDRAMQELYGRYTTEQLALLGDFTERLDCVLEEETLRLRSNSN